VRIVARASTVVVERLVASTFPVTTRRQAVDPWTDSARALQHIDKGVR
jgi:hypothetical protein